jgi:hypothetical protein
VSQLGIFNFTSKQRDVRQHQAEQASALMAASQPVVRVYFIVGLGTICAILLIGEYETADCISHIVIQYLRRV